MSKDLKGRLSRQVHDIVLGVAATEFHPELYAAGLLGGGLSLEVSQEAAIEVVRRNADNMRRFLELVEAGEQEACLACINKLQTELQERAE